MNKQTNTHTARRKLTPGEEIRIWMLREHLKASVIAREIGVSPAAITRFLDGKLVSQHIRKYYIAKGCPEALLDQLGKA